MAYLKGDWTRQDPAITAFLREHGRDGVPLYVFFPPGASRGAAADPDREEVLAELRQGLAPWLGMTGAIVRWRCGSKGPWTTLLNRRAVTSATRVGLAAVQRRPRVTWTISRTGLWRSYSTVGK